jgi:hypothetical protein
MAWPEKRAEALFVPPGPLNRWPPICPRAICGVSLRRWRGSIAQTSEFRSFPESFQPQSNKALSRLSDTRVASSRRNARLKDGATGEPWRASLRIRPPCSGRRASLPRARRRQRPHSLPSSHGQRKRASADARAEAHSLGGAGSLTGTLQLQRVLKIGDIDGTGAGARWPANGSKRDDESRSYSASVHLTVVWSFDHATGWRIIAPAWQVSFPIYAFYRPWGTIV